VGKASIWAAAITNMAVVVGVLVIALWTDVVIDTLADVEIIMASDVVIAVPVSYSVDIPSGVLADA